MDTTSTISAPPRADVAMYKAKSAGGNKFQYFAAEMNAEALDRLDMETRLRRAVENNELEIHYQPKFNRRADQPIGLEALLRWAHPTLGRCAAPFRSPRNLA